MAEPACTIVLGGPYAGDRYRITAESPYAGSLRLNGVGYSRLRSVGKEVRGSLEESGIGTAGMTSQPDADRMYDALEEIRAVGWAALSALTSDECYRAQPAKLREYLTAVLNGAPASTRPVLRFKLPVDLDLPLDLMPALQPDRADFRPDSPRGLYKRACQWFVGLQFVVQKIRIGNENDGSDKLVPRYFREGPRVTLAPYWHRGLADVNDSVTKLSQLGFFDVQPALPNDRIIKLRDGREAARLLVHGRKHPEAIVHIAGHCDAKDGLSSLDHCLRLAGGRGLGRKELRLKVKYLKSGGAGVAAHRPLAVITACGASDVRFDTPVSIPDALLYVGFRAVVSPLVSVNVDPGYAVTMHLYAAMKKGEALGEALVTARRQLLERRGHTLGLLHTCYGDTRLHLDPEVVALPSRDRIAA
jgi:hypothetical protein